MRAIKEFVRNMHTNEVWSGGMNEHRWCDQIKLNERCTFRGGGLEQGKRNYLDREKWKVYCHGHPLGGAFRGIEESGSTDRYTD